MTQFDSLDQLQVRFVAVLSEIQTLAGKRFRHLRCPGRRDDAIAEVVALTWRRFLRLGAQQREVHLSIRPLAERAIQQVRHGRQLCS